MPHEDRKYHILFLIGAQQNALKPMLPELCAKLIKKGHDVHIIYANKEDDETFMDNIRKVPWIFISKLPFVNKLAMSSIYLPLKVRKYINKHEGLDIIHSFGLECGLVGLLARIGIKTKTINTPIKIEQDSKKGFNLALKFIVDNILFISNRLTNKVLFLSEAEKGLASASISYRNAKSDCLDINAGADKIADRFMEVYSAV